MSVPTTTSSFGYDEIAGKIVVRFMKFLVQDSHLERVITTEIAAFHRFELANVNNAHRGKQKVLPAPSAQVLWLQHWPIQNLEPNEVKLTSAGKKRHAKFKLFEFNAADETGETLDGMRLMEAVSGQIRPAEQAKEWRVFRSCQAVDWQRTFVTLTEGPAAFCLFFFSSF